MSHDRELFPWKLIFLSNFESDLLAKVFIDKVGFSAVCENFKKYKQRKMSCNDFKKCVRNT